MQHTTSTRAVGPDRFHDHATPEAAMAEALRLGCIWRPANATRYCAADLTDPEADAVIHLTRSPDWPRHDLVYVEGSCGRHATAVRRRIAASQRETR